MNFQFIAIYFYLIILLFHKPFKYGKLLKIWYLVLLYLKHSIEFYNIFQGSHVSHDGNNLQNIPSVHRWINIFGAFFEVSNKLQI